MDHRIEIFVANRVTEIFDASDPKDRLHIPGDQKPADLLRRGSSDPVGSGDVLSIPCEKYYVMRGRVVIKQVVNRCFFCCVRRER